ncbi:unnamed protein product [Bemisia tabaci]|uniref:Uncharacterized protein n=1 Tax=Bemisia tabaci TaxID=7038 RepID=A0A9P0EYJ1_BEMTA|nr:unnamed protein product [Bemisia tabaci]
MKSVIGALIVSPLWFLIRVDVSIAENIGEPFVFDSARYSEPLRNPLHRNFSTFMQAHNQTRGNPGTVYAGDDVKTRSIKTRSLLESQVAQDRFNPSTFAHLKHLKAAAHNAIAQALPHEPSPESFFATGQFQVDDSIGADSGNIYLNDPSDGQFVNVGASGQQFVDNGFSSQSDATYAQFDGGASSNQQSALISSNFIDDQYDSLQEPSQLNSSRLPLADDYPPPRPGSSYLPPPPDPAPSYHTADQYFPPYIPPSTDYVPPPPSPSGNGSVPPKTYLPPSPTSKPVVVPAGYAYPVPIALKPAPSTAAPLYLPPKQVAYVYNPPKQEGYSYNPPNPSPLPGPAYLYLPPPQPQPRPPPPPPPLLPPAPPPTPADEEEDEREAQYYYYGVGRHLWYVPLYFSIYFIIYVGYLILRSIARHKVQLPAMLHEAAAASARFEQDEFLMKIFQNLSGENFKFRPNKK